MALLENKTAVITGSSKGIGRGIALELAREGARVLINYRGGHAGTEGDREAQYTIALVKEITGAEPEVCIADMSVEADVERLAQTALEKLGKVDIWVNNVGSHVVTPALTQTKEEWDRLFSLNTTSAFMGCREAAKVMRNGGSIINIASKMGLAGSAENACYCAAKAAVIMMTRCLAAEWAMKNIRVNVIAPGVTLTDPTYVVVDGKPALEAALHYRTPMQRFARPDEIGKAAVFLASDMSSYITGETISCDGGWGAHTDFAGIPVDKLETWDQEFPRLKKE